MRTEDHRFLTGAGRYVDDIAEPGALHAVFLRSPHAHAGIRRIALDRAGVVAAWCLDDLVPDPPGQLACLALPPGAPVTPRPALADRRVRHVGEAVAVVIAESATAARDAAERAAIDYEPLPAVTDAEAALAPGAPLLFAAAPGNLGYRFAAGDAAAAEAALARSAHVVAARIGNQRVMAAALEPRAAIARHGPGGFDLELSGQGVHALRDLLATILGEPPARVRVRCPDVGGGFGPKNCLYPEYVVLLWAARRLGRTVRWTAERGEDLCSTVHARALTAQARLGLDAEGRILALAIDAVADLGAALSTTGPGSATVSMARALGGGYAVPAVSLRVRGAYTNTTPIDAYRGAGKPEANLIVERLLDLAAARLGRDPAELRRRNFPALHPHPTALGTTIEPGRFAANIPLALEAADRHGFPARRAASEARGRRRGFALTCFLETARGAPDEGATLAVRPDGRITLAVGTQSNGQGHETSFPALAGRLLGLPPAQFVYVQADTAQVAAGHGHGGARSLHQGGAALAEAATALLAAARPIAARLLQSDAATLAYEGGAFRDGARSVTLAEIGRQEAAEGAALAATVWNRLDAITFPNGAHVAEVELDPETGAIALARYVAVDDYGTVLDPVLTAGQVMGGLAQGIGQALHEHVAFDASGQLLSGSLMDYALPRAADLPALLVRLEGVPSQANPVGAKGAGQAGAIAAPPAVVAAAMDALAPLGIVHLDMPLTSERVWRAIRAAGVARDPAALPAPGRKPGGDDAGQGTRAAETPPDAGC